MSTPYFSDGEQCERCGYEIEVDDEAFMSVDGIFCSQECIEEHLWESAHVETIYLTDDKLHAPDFTWEE